MSTLKETVIYDCECWSYCNKKSYFRFEYTGSGHTEIFHKTHDEDEERIGIFNDKQLSVIKNNI